MMPIRPSAIRRMVTAYRAIAHGLRTLLVQRTISSPAPGPLDFHPAAALDAGLTRSRKGSMAMLDDHLG
jgi:hypothetical protein